MGVMAVRFRRAVLALAGAATLQGCVVAAVGGAAVGSVVVMADRRSTGMQLLDAQIEHKINVALDDRFSRESVRIDVTSYDQQVLLAGQVPQEKDRADAEAVARAADSVRGVTNDLTIGSMAGLSNGANDALLAGKVKAALLGAKGLAPEIVKTTATMGNVYLFGRVSSQEADIAKSAASQVAGVKRVVALFEILSPEEYAKVPQPQSPPPPKMP